MRKQETQDKRFSEHTGKLHMPCAHKDKTCISTHVVIKDGACYRAGICLVIECKHNSFQSDMESLLSITW